MSSRAGRLGNVKIDQNFFKWSRCFWQGDELELAGHFWYIPIDFALILTPSDLLLVYTCNRNHYKKEVGEAWHIFPLIART